MAGTTITGKIRDLVGAGVGAFSGSASAMTEVQFAKLIRDGLSERQLRLNNLWAWYLGLNYDTRNHEWDGSEVVDQLSAQAICSSGIVPPSYWQHDNLPLRFRRPSAPYRLVTVITNRFSGLLFSAKRHPTFLAAGASDVEDYATALADAARLWPTMILARQYGGSMGSVAMSFKYIEG